MRRARGKWSWGTWSLRSMRRSSLRWRWGLWRRSRSLFLTTTPSSSTSSTTRSQGASDPSRIFDKKIQPAQINLFAFCICLHICMSTYKSNKNTKQGNLLMLMFFLPGMWATTRARAWSAKFLATLRHQSWRQQLMWWECGICSTRWHRSTIVAVFLHCPNGAQTTISAMILSHFQSNLHCHLHRYSSTMASKLIFIIFIVFLLTLSYFSAFVFILLNLT